MNRVLARPGQSSPKFENSQDVTIGERIRIARKKLDLNQVQLAERLGVSQPTVANWESGVHDPRRLMLAKISETLSVPLNWLTEGARSQTESDTHSAAAYLRRYLQHVPVISYENAGRFINPRDVDPHDWAEDYIPVTYGAARLFAIFVTDDAVNLAFPPGTLVMIDYSERTPIDEGFCLAMVKGQSVLRRWRTDPVRLEPYSSNPDHETLYADESSQIIGMVRVSIRFH